MTTSDATAAQQSRIIDWDMPSGKRAFAFSG